MTLDIYFPKFAPFLLSEKTAPAFAKLCSIGQWQQDQDHPLEATLCRQFGLQKQQDWPLSLMAAMGEDLVFEAEYLFLVHPANFILQRDFFSFGEAIVLPPEDQTRLIDDLNAHFKDYGLGFVAGPSSAFWYLKVQKPVNVSTTLLSGVMGRDVGPLMPQGNDGMAFQTLMNEVQMLMHEHPMNQEREANGLPLVNSLWLSGGGSVQALLKGDLKRAFTLFANDPVSKGLAKWAETAYLPLVRYDFSEIDSFENDAVIVVEETGDLEHDWFLPLLKSLQKHSVKAVCCHFDVHGITYTLKLKPRDTWKFWKKTLNPESYFTLASAD